MRVIALASVCFLAFAATLRAADVVTVSAYDPQFTAEQRAKLEGAVSLANRVLASAEFRAELERIQRFNLSNDDGARVLRTLLASSRTLRFEAVARYAIRIGPFRRKSAMVASTGEGSGQITFNTVRMPEFDEAFYAGTVAHEVCHLVGYRHDGNKPTAFNQGTVPYQVGELVRRLAEGLLTPSHTGGLAGGLGDATDDDASTPDTPTTQPDTPVTTQPATTQPTRRPTFLARLRQRLSRLFRRR